MISIGEIAQTFSGGTPPRGKTEYYKGNIPWIKSGELNSYSIVKTEEFISEEGLKNSSAKIVDVDTLLIALYGATAGVTAFTRISAAINQAVLAILPNEKMVDKVFLFHFLQYSRQDIISTFCQGGQPNLSAEIIKSIKLPFLPPLPEQIKIAKILSTWDELIEKQTKLIAAKIKRKKALMQVLLTGEVRFKGFEKNEWNSIKLREVVSDFIVPMRDKPKKLNGNIPWCRIEDFEGKYLFGSKSGQGVDRDVIKEMNLKIYPLNTVLVSCSAYLGRCAIVKAPLITNQTFIGLVPGNSLDEEYLYYAMLFMERDLNVLSSGTTISYLSRQEFENFEIGIPESKNEQNKIASVLCSCDAEIVLLEKVLNGMEHQKKGMMQQLLTGKIRVKA